MSVSPAKLVRQILADAGVVIMPGVREVRGDPHVQCFTNTAPDEINNCLLVRDAPGVAWGHDQRTGERLAHRGVMMTMRNEDEGDGEDAMYAVEAALKGVANRTVEVGDYSHHVQSVYTTTDVISLGEEVGKRRFLWSLHARVAMQAKEPTLVE